MAIGAFLSGFAADFRRSPQTSHIPRRHRSAQVLKMTATSTPAQVQTQPSDRSADAENLVKTYVMNTYARYDITLTRGQGVKVMDANDKEYFDFVSGIATCCLGHASPVLNDAVAQQMSRLHHVSNLYYIPEQGQLAQWLVEHSPADKVFFCNSGAEANETAIKLVRKYASTRRGIADGVIITANQSFHGRTLATVTATGQTKYHEHFSPLVPGFAYVSYNDAAGMREAFDKYGDRIVAVMLEACQGEGGVVPGDAEFFRTVRQLCDDNDALLILDEVQVGIGRTGKLWGFENLDVQPDVLTLAKGLGGGVPIGATLCTTKVDVFQPGDHASTFGGNPLSCAAALAVTKTVGDERGEFLGNVAARGEQLRAELNRLREEHPGIVREVRGWGLINGLELDEACGLTSSDFVRHCTEKGLLLVPAGPKVVRFVPPLIISEEEMTQALKIFAQVFESLADKKE